MGTILFSYKSPPFKHYGFLQNFRFPKKSPNFFLYRFRCIHGDRAINNSKVNPNYQQFEGQSRLSMRKTRRTHPAIHKVGFLFCGGGSRSGDLFLGAKRLVFCAQRFTSMRDPISARARERRRKLMCAGFSPPNDANPDWQRAQIDLLERHTAFNGIFKLNLSRFSLASDPVERCKIGGG